MTLVKTTDIALHQPVDDPYRLTWEAMQKQPAETKPRALQKSRVFALMYQDPAAD